MGSGIFIANMPPQTGRGIYLFPKQACRIRQASWANITQNLNKPVAPLLKYRFSKLFTSRNPAISFWEPIPQEIFL